MTTPDRDWVPTRELTEELGVSERTLRRLKVSGYLKPGHHYRKVNPQAPRSRHVWHRHRVAIRLGAH